jgi:hypothetical protein
MIATARPGSDTVLSPPKNNGQASADWIQWMALGIVHFLKFPGGGPYKNGIKSRSAVMYENDLAGDAGAHLFRPLAGYNSFFCRSRLYDRAPALKRAGGPASPRALHARNVSPA